MSNNPLGPDNDPFKPPTIPTVVSCLHCGEEYDSYLIEWRVEAGESGSTMGFWCCPTPGCDGQGFGFDIFPLDPEYCDENGNRMWCGDDDDDEEDGEFGEDNGDGFSSEDNEDEKDIPF